MELKPTASRQPVSADKPDEWADRPAEYAGQERGECMAAKDLLPIPNLMSMRRVLAIAPHPDDNEGGAGATLAKLIGLGARVDWVVATDGAVGTLDSGERDSLVATRRREQEAAIAVLGGGGLSWLGFPDMGLRDRRAELTTAVFRAIRAAAPDVVLCPDPWMPYESHPDHRTLGMAVTEAVSMAHFPMVEPAAGGPVEPPAIAYYGTAWPNTRVDVADTFDQKLRALWTHASQFAEPAQQVLGYYLRVRAAEYGAEAGVELAEAFKVLSVWHLHFYPDAWQS